MSFGTPDALAGPELNARFDAIRARAVPIAAVGLGACVLGALAFPASFFPAYLTAFLFWTGISVASIGPTASEKLREVGLPVHVEASPPKMGPLVRAAIQEAEERLSGRA